MTQKLAAKPFFIGKASPPTPSLFLIRKMDEAAKFWDIGKGATGGFPDRHKKTSQLVASWREKAEWARGRG